MRDVLADSGLLDAGFSVSNSPPHGLKVLGFVTEQAAVPRVLSHTGGSAAPRSYHPVAISSRVSSTAACQIASTSASGRM